MTPIRVIAGMLAAGGIFWGLFLLPMVIGGDWAHFRIGDLGLIAGYLVTIGCFVRCCSKHPSLLMRRSIWIFSMLVQGGWLGWYIWGAVHGGARLNDFIFVTWWLFAFGASLVGLFADSQATST